MPTAAFAQLSDPAFAPTTLLKAGYARAVVAQSAGKMVVLDRTYSTSRGYDTRLVRYTATGELDAGFDEQNYRELSTCSGMLPLPTGNILLVGSGNIMVNRITRYGLLVLDADGRPDESFHATGLAQPDGIDWAAVQPDGKLLLRTHHRANSAWQELLQRVLPNGAPDPSFTADASLLLSNLRTVAVQADGKILLAGRAGLSSRQPTRAVVRLQADGTLDTTFDCPYSFSVNELQALPDGKILLGSEYDYVGTPGAQPLMRLLPTGQPDPAFAVKAGRQYWFKYNYQSRGLTVLHDGRILAAYTSSSPASVYSDTLVCYLPDGRVDAAFSTGSQAPVISGTAELTTGDIAVLGYFNRLNEQPANNLAVLDPAGRPRLSFRQQLYSPGEIETMQLLATGSILVGGTFAQINGIMAGNLALLRADGTVDTAFTRRCYADDAVLGVAVQPDQRVIVSGRFRRVGNFYRQAVVRLLPSGDVDATYGTGLKGLSGYPSQLALEANGGVLLGGNLSYNTPTTQYSGLVSLTPQGMFDAGFRPNLSYDVRVLRVLSDQSVLVGGRKITYSDHSLVRLHPNGTTTYYKPASLQAVNCIQETAAHQLLISGEMTQPDDTALGVIRLDADGREDPTYRPKCLYGALDVHTMLVQPNGRLLVSGLVQGTANVYVTLRYMPDGTPDASFSSPVVDKVTSMLVQPDGKLLLAGHFQRAGGVPAMGITRLIAEQVLATAKQTTPDQVVAYPNPVRDILHLALPAGAAPRLVTLLDLTGKVVATYSPAQTALPVQAVPNGVYLLRVAAATGQAATQKITVIK